MPALASQVMAGGFSAGQATALNGTLKTAISAAGTTLATATALTNATNLVSTAAAGAGVALPTAAAIGDTVYVFNDGSGNTMVVYPHKSTAQINNVTAGSGINLANNTACYFTMISATRWIANMSA